MSRQDKPIFTAVLRQLEIYTIPRARGIKAGLDRGEKITDYDLEYFMHAISDTQQMVPVAERNQEYQKLVTRVSCLYRGIVEQAVQNEQDGTLLN
jgi:hypothetical protein